jgi:hypothetical protein
VAFVVAHVSVELCPGAMDVGFAVNASQVGALGVDVTVTVTWQFTEPATFVAVSVKVVVVFTVTPREPSPATPPTLVIETEFAFVVFHASVTTPGLVSVLGVAVNASQLGAPTGGGTIVTVT